MVNSSRHAKRMTTSRAREFSTMTSTSVSVTTRGAARGGCSRSSSQRLPGFGNAKFAAASFVVLDANPLDDITNTRRLADVYIDGRRVDRAALLARLSSSR